MVAKEPIRIPQGTPTTAARRKPSITRRILAVASAMRIPLRAMDRRESRTRAGEGKKAGSTTCA